MIQLAWRSSVQLPEVDDDRRQGDGRDHQLEAGQEHAGARARRAARARPGDPSRECRRGGPRGRAPCRATGRRGPGDAYSPASGGSMGGRTRDRAQVPAERRRRRTRCSAPSGLGRPASSRSTCAPPTTGSGASAASRSAGRVRHVLTRKRDVEGIVREEVETDLSRGGVRPAGRRGGPGPPRHPQGPPRHLPRPLDPRARRLRRAARPRAPRGRARPTRRRPGAPGRRSPPSSSARCSLDPRLHEPPDRAARPSTAAALRAHARRRWPDAPIPDDADRDDLSADRGRPRPPARPRRRVRGAQRHADRPRQAVQAGPRRPGDASAGGPRPAEAAGSRGRDRVRRAARAAAEEARPPRPPPRRAPVRDDAADPTSSRSPRPRPS